MRAEAERIQREDTLEREGLDPLEGILIFFCYIGVGTQLLGKRVFSGSKRSSRYAPLLPLLSTPLLPPYPSIPSTVLLLSLLSPAYLPRFASGARLDG